MSIDAMKDILQRIDNTRNNVVFLSENETVTKTILLADGDSLSVNGNCKIIADLPIEAIGTITITGEVGSTLSVICVNNLQPCIGPGTSTDMSDGRWSPHASRNGLDKIIVDKVKVTLKSAAGDFTMGTYNSEEVPVVECINGGELEAPEIHGTRYLVKKAVPPVGSTKISELAEYKVVPDGRARPFNSAQEKYISMMREYDIPMLSSEEMTSILAEDMKSIIDYFPLGADVALAYRNYDRVRGNVGTYLGAIFVGVEPDNEELLNAIDSIDFTGILGKMNVDIIKRETAYEHLFSFDENKSKDDDFIKYMLKSYLWTNNINIDTLNFSELQFWWELIPTEEYNNHNDKKSDVEDYYKEPTISDGIKSAMEVKHYDRFTIN